MLEDNEIAPDGGPKGNRVWLDGCFDVLHFGHANALRQAKQFGKVLVAGVHSDAEILFNKGPPVFNEQERYRMVKGIKWVDEVVENVPLTTSIETLDRYNCDFCVHGDDPSISADGKDTFEEVKKANRYRECKRTAGVSTTDIVGRMLLMTRSHHVPEEGMDEYSERVHTLSTDRVAVSPWTRVSRFVASTKTISQFAEGIPPKPTDKIVYVCGAFDLFHVGHLSFLEEAAKLGDYLIVGILSDQVVNKVKGSNYPIMSLHERVLTVLAFKPVNEVMIGVPYCVSDDIIQQFNISDAANLITILQEEIHSKHQKEEGFIHRLDYERRNAKKEKKEAAAFAALQKMNAEGTVDTKKIVNIEL
ncbi:unnamed protein product [Cylicocyclus nassatus]|uniref:ethanolamine-phosphate cytidylyltransferase n=1 Tax=Cylicocyclus nassatus TaxID=53992 RepID=A0AA36H8Q4_CYLNA|nr:unnamed protein product [Cylicocyclus nassatus]